MARHLRAPQRLWWSPAGGGASNKIDAARVTEILSETNKMLKALATPATTSTASSSAPLDPIEMIPEAA